jgi:hypothetical protein
MSTSLQCPICMVMPAIMLLRKVGGHRPRRSRRSPLAGASCSCSVARRRCSQAPVIPPRAIHPPPHPSPQVSNHLDLVKAQPASQLPPISNRAAYDAAVLARCAAGASLMRAGGRATARGCSPMYGLLGQARDPTHPPTHRSLHPNPPAACRQRGLAVARMALGSDADAAGGLVR